MLVANDLDLGICDGDYLTLSMTLLTTILYLRR